MSIVGKVESVWRYPVKSMRGEELQELFVGYAGVYGDRRFAFRSSAAPFGFPFFTAREQGKMLLYRPQYRHPEKAATPVNLAAAEALPPGVTPMYSSSADLALDVETPAGQMLAIDDPALIGQLREGIREAHQLTLLESDRALTDCRPISIFSLQTAQQLSKEVGDRLDKRRFRANIYLDLESMGGFGEDQFVGKQLRIGSKAVIAVLERDPRCKMITLDPDTGKANPEVMKCLARLHDGKAGVYAAVIAEGMICGGDDVVVV